MKQLNIHYFQHVPYEDLGCIERWAKENNHIITSTKFYESYSLPELDSVDWLIVMGGPMGVYDNKKYPWLKEEKETINKAIQANKTVIGICLGAQLIADILGARVYPNQYKEIGWFDISPVKEGKNTYLLEGVRKIITVFHWHGDTFDLPENSTHLFESEGCKNQGFLFKENVLGLQFHFEVTEENLKNMVNNGNNELIPDGFIQSGNEILIQKEHIQNCNRSMYQLLNSLTTT